jgi:succinate dehydrogenase/fumarate reductase flavoprotein subunit
VPVTDVLVIGSGGAGLVAACAARRAGATVTLVTKSLPGLASCTAYAGGGFTLPYGDITPAKHRSMTLEIGRNLSLPHMLDALSSEAGEAVPRLREFGVRIDMESGHASVARYGIGPMLGGTGMTLPLVENARQAGVTILDRIMVTGILTSDGRVSGVRVLDTSKGTLSTIPAKTVIVAAGGAGRIYSRTDNPVRTTGDGFALLAELGLPFIDMEFVQFYPIGFAEPGFPVWMIGLNWVDHAPVTNEKGERFLQTLWRQWGMKNGREANLFTRDRSSRAIASEWARGGQVWLHVEEVPDAAWQTPHGSMIRKMFPSSRPPSAGPIRVRPVQHYFAGGAFVKADCSTEVKGLFACGEVTGGTDGANRIGGNALSMITVFGFRASESALDYLSAWEPCEAPDQHKNDLLARRWLASRSGPSPSALKKALNEITDNKLAVVRNYKGLSAAESLLDDLWHVQHDMTVASPAELFEAYEARNLVLVARMVAKAALLREESRGVHYREDFPEEKEEWLKHIEIRLRDGDIDTRTF